MLRRVAKLSFSGIGRSSFCSKQASAQTASSGPVPKDSSQPKWMRFFVGHDKQKVDLERSMKSEANAELLSTYIKQHYTEFDNAQLISVLPKLNRTIAQQIRAEMRLRIATESFELTLEEAIALLDTFDESFANDKLLIVFTITTLTARFDEMAHFQQAKLLMLAIRMHILSAQIACKFLDGFAAANVTVTVTELGNSSEVRKDIFDRVDYIGATNYMLVLAHLKGLLVDEQFDSRLPDSLRRTLAQAYLKKTALLVEDNEVLVRVYLERIFNPEIFKLMDYEQKIAYKKIIIQVLELKFDSERHLGRFGYSRDDKSLALSKGLVVLQTMVQPKERKLVERVMVLVGNFLMSRDVNDFKFDFRLFAHLSRYSYAYKYYIDESFISMKSLVRSHAFSSKKSLIDDSFHITLQKYKTYSDLNYADIIQRSEDVYTRKVDFSDSMSNQWNQFERDLQNCIKEYLSQQLQAGTLNRIPAFSPAAVAVEQLTQEMPSTTVTELDERITEVPLDDVETEETITSGRRTVTTTQEEEELVLKQVEMYQEEWDTDEKPVDATAGSVGGAASSSNSVKEDQDYANRVGSKLGDLQLQLGLQKYAKFITFAQKIPQEHALLVRYWVTSLEAIAQSIYSCEPSEDFIGVLRMWAKQESQADVFERFCMMPGVVENLLLIDAWATTQRNQQLFTHEMSQKLHAIQTTINSFFAKIGGGGVESESSVQGLKAPSEYLKALSEEIAQLQNGGELPVDKGYESNQLINQMMNQSYVVPSDTAQEVRDNLQSLSEGRMRVKNHRDFNREQYVASKENVLRKIAHSSVFSNFVNESHLKKYVSDVLCQMSAKVQKNVVFYPGYADFIIPSIKLAVMVNETNRLVGGVENVLTGAAKSNEQLLRALGYRVTHVEYSDFDTDFRIFQENILKKISINNTHS